MDQPNGRCCPKCSSTDYRFRTRKKITVDPEKGQPEQWETKRRCQPCGHEWKELEPSIAKRQEDGNAANR